jgi:NitT/TauT family transport system substrate-binding protein
MKRRQALSMTAGALAAPLFIRGAQADDTPVRIAGVTTDGGGQVYYAREMGFFKKAGLTNVTIETFSSGGPLASAVASGAVDIGDMNTVSLVRAHHQRLPFISVAPSGLYQSNEPTSVLMVKAISPLKTAADFDGKTIAVSALGGIAQIAPTQWIDQHGGQSSTVKFLEMPQPDLIAAIASGRIDAGLVIEPYVANAKPVCRVIANCFDSIAPKFVLAVYFSTTDWTKAHPETARRFHVAMAETAVWANKNRSRTADMLSKIAKLPADDLRQMKRVFYPTDIDPALLQPVVDSTAKFSNFGTFPAAELIFKA